MSTTRVVILAAGKGKRMGAELPKPLVPIAGRPMIAHLLESVRESGVDGRPIVVVAPDVAAIFAQTLNSALEYALQIEPLGTGHAVLSAKDAWKTADRIIVLYGDHPFISAQVLRRLVALHDTTPESVAMLTSTVPNFDAPYDAFRAWGRVLRDDQGEVIAIREAKDCSVGELAVREVNPGIYVFPAPWALEKLSLIGNENASKEYYLVDLIGFAMAEGRPIVTAEADPLDVIGVNTPDELRRAEEVFKRQKSG